MQEVRETLEINYEVDLPRYRRIWFEGMLAGVPNILAFWGVAFVSSIFLAFLFPDTPFFMWLALLIAAIPVLNTYYSYRNYMAHIRRMLTVLSEEEIFVTMRFQTNEDWFEIFNGKNYTRFSWESVKGVAEKKDYFLFQLGTNSYPIPKNAFRSESDVRLLRLIVSNNVEKNVKLLS